MGSGTLYRDQDATEAGSEYTYCVKAVRDGTNFSECSNHASITVAGETSDSTTPETTPDEGNRHPTNLTVSLVDGVVVLTWDAPTLEAGSITGYEVLRRRPGRERTPCAPTWPTLGPPPPPTRIPMPPNRASGKFTGSRRSGAGRKAGAPTTSGWTSRSPSRNPPGRRSRRPHPHRNLPPNLRPNRRLLSRRPRRRTCWERPTATVRSPFPGTTRTTTA